MIKSISRFFSYLFHPLFLPTISIFLLFNLPFYVNYKYSYEYRLVIYLLIFLNTAIIPLLISLYLKNKNLIGSLEMHSGKERRLPYLVCSILFVFTFLLLRKINFPYIYLAFFRSVCITVIILFLLAVIEYKISAHMAGLGGLCGMLSVLAIGFSVDIGILLYISIFISGLVGSARLYLEMHSIYQILFGFLVGFAAQFYLLLF